MAQHHLLFNEIANNIVYCLAGVETPNAGSQFLARVRRDAVLQWKERYGDTLKAFQTFILPPRTGAMYKADNWTVIGETSGKESLRAQTIRPCDVEAYVNEHGSKRLERRVFRSGEVKYLVWTPHHTEAKIVFMRLA